jgi:hypothetical protein
LVNEKAAEKKSEESPVDRKKSKSKLVNGIRAGFSQFSVMLEPPHLKNACLVYTIQFFILFGFVLRKFSEHFHSVLSFIV